MYIIPLYQSNVQIQFSQRSCEFNTINSYKFPHTLACKSVTSFETHLLRTGLFSQPFLPHFQEAKAEIEEHIFKNCNYTCFNVVHYRIKYQLIINEDFNQNHTHTYIYVEPCRKIFGISYDLIMCQLYVVFVLIIYFCTSSNTCIYIYLETFNKVYIFFRRLANFQNSQEMQPHFN